MNTFPLTPTATATLAVGVFFVVTPLVVRADPPPAPAPAAAPQPATAPAPATAPTPPAAPPADFRKGALRGHVVDAVTGKPLADATVALQDKNGKVVAWSKTDANGDYAIASDTLGVLGLRPSRRRGLLASLARGVGQVVSAPVKIAADVVKQVNPVGTVKSAVVSAATGSPIPLASQVVQTVTNQAQQKAKETAVKTMLGERQAAPPKDKRDEVVPGEVRIAVSAPGYQEVRAKAGAYWMEPADEAPKNETKEQQAKRVGVRAWLENVKLAPAGAPADKKGEVENAALLLAAPRLEPSLAAPGGTVHVVVTLQAPPPPPGKTLAQSVRVFAREDKKHTTVELKSADPNAPNVYTGDLTLDAKMPVGDTTVSVVALRADPVEVNLHESKADPLLDFAQRLDELDPGQPYDFDPRIMASENRLDLQLTVLDPKQSTPAATVPAPAVIPATAPPATPPAPAAPPATPPAPAKP